MTALSFISPAHRERFLTAIQGIGKVSAGALDPEYAAALYVLTASTGTWNKTSGYVDSEGIDFEAMLREVDFSGGYSVLILLVGNLFNGEQHVDPIELLRLDEEHFQLAMAALQLRRSTHRLGERENDE